MPWTIIQLFTKAQNEWTQIEHNMGGRRVAWSPLWRWPCSFNELHSTIDINDSDTKCNFDLLTLCQLILFNNKKILNVTAAGLVESEVHHNSINQVCTIYFPPRTKQHCNNRLKVYYLQRIRTCTTYDVFPQNCRLPK